MTSVISNELDNLIIGGDFNTNPWQRGTTFVSPASGDYTADRFQYRATGVQAFTITKNIDKPTFAQTGLFSTFSLDADVTTPNTAPGVNDFTTIEQPLEGFMAAPIYDNKFGLTFWVKASLPGIYCVSFQNAARDRSYIVEYLINSADTWELKTIQAIHETSGGTWETGNLAGLRVIFSLNASANLHGIANNWQAGNFVSTVNQVNASGTLGNNFRISLVRCVHGIPGTAFYTRCAGEELILSQRYYLKSYNSADYPGAITTSGNVSGFTTAVSTLASVLTESTKVSMRITPTVTWYSPVTGAINNLANITDAGDLAISSTADEGEGHVGYPVTTASLAANKLIKAHYTAEAEI